MTDSNAGLSEKRMAFIIGYILRIGVICAGVLVLAGGIIFLMIHAKTVVDFRVFDRGAGMFPGIRDITRYAAALDGVSLIQAGILVLIATPVLRVIFSLLSFVIQKDRIYSVFSAVVLLNLLFSLFGRGLR